MSVSKSTKAAIGFMRDEQIRAQPKRPDESIIARYRALDDLSGTVSDALDQLGISGVIPASTLRPTLTGRRVVGPAITLRNVPQQTEPHQALTTKDYRMTEIEAIHQAEPGDVLVIQGVRHVSNMGGIVAKICTREKLAAAIVDGGVRDVDKSRALGFPIWSRDISPVTGKWRVISVEVNGTIAVAGLTVQAGDLVVADETGTCFVPQDRVEEVIRLCEQIDKKESAWVVDVGAGASVPEVMKKIYK
jgi:4-hydroxy-4-methyl-2-oxoglutarate aldolase